MFEQVNCVVNIYLAKHPNLSNQPKLDQLKGSFILNSLDNYYLKRILKIQEGYDF